MQQISNQRRMLLIHGLPIVLIMIGSSMVAYYLASEGLNPIYSGLFLLACYWNLSHLIRSRKVTYRIESGALVGPSPNFVKTRIALHEIDRSQGDAGAIRSDKHFLYGSYDIQSKDGKCVIRVFNGSLGPTKTKVLFDRLEIPYKNYSVDRMRDILVPSALVTWFILIGIFVCSGL